MRLIAWIKYESRRQKTYLWACAFVQSDQSPLSACIYVVVLAIRNALKEDSDQTTRMCRLIWIFAGCTSEVRFLTLCPNSGTVCFLHVVVKFGFFFFFSSPCLPAHLHEPYLRTFAPSEDLHQSSFSRSIIRIFARRSLDSPVHVCNVSSCEQRLWSDCAGPRWAHMAEVRYFTLRLK